MSIGDRTYTAKEAKELDATFALLKQQLSAVTAELAMLLAKEK